ncbi:SDR family oxidoreductase [Natrinema altunense]|uniref:Short chain dehydrogenase n=1 Tax=Natrinema altunense (strain JCM 12890 / CGMCC 1.3731 / AJ2) TaxID=1227494 RepID=L9ZWS9_NATA2|nr:SDR family oxidoreductase [Natrinema altunense]ELY90496.1 short chain dehydrogenase [Natrinema altunense JCM 12890]
MPQKPDLSGQAAFITGTTRGIGKQLALALAEHGCDIVSTGKTVDDSDSDLEGTIHKTAEECAEKGVETHAIQLDVRDEDAIEAAVEEAIDEMGEINIVINNASAIQMGAVEDLPAGRYDLLNEVNVRGTYLVSRAFIDHLKGVEEDAWILTNAPPVELDRAPGSAAYSWSKMGMSFVTLSMAQELADDEIGCNTFWPVTAIDTRATRYFEMGTEDDWRTPDIVSDTVLEILARDPAEFTGNRVYDEDFLREAGVENFAEYNLTEGDPEPTSAQLFDPNYSRPDDA